MIPTKKISQALIEYAEPMINDLGEHYAQRDLENVLRFATVIWNACVMDKWAGNTMYVDTVRTQMATTADFMPSALVEVMIERKQQLFGDDPRGITNECVIVKNGQLTVRAEARLGTKTAADKNSKISKRRDGARG